MGLLVCGGGLIRLWSQHPVKHKKRFLGIASSLFKKMILFNLLIVRVIVRGQF